MRKPTQKRCNGWWEERLNGNGSNEQRATSNENGAMEAATARWAMGEFPVLRDARWEKATPHGFVLRDSRCEKATAQWERQRRNGQCVNGGFADAPLVEALP
jgi:hypothetical protein